MLSSDNPVIKAISHLQLYLEIGFREKDTNIFCPMVKCGSKLENIKEKIQC